MTAAAFAFMPWIEKRTGEGRRGRNKWALRKIVPHE
jgi:hypothetical protein